MNAAVNSRCREIDNERWSPLDLNDYFTFEAAEPRSLEAEPGEGGLRYPVLVLVDGREFERIQLDVNFVAKDPMPIERLQLRNLLDFAEIDPPQVPVVHIAQHLAEKVHAYARDYVHADSRPQRRTEEDIRRLEASSRSPNRRANVDLIDLNDFLEALPIGRTMARRSLWSHAQAVP